MTTLRRVLLPVLCATTLWATATGFLAAQDTHGDIGQKVKEAYLLMSRGTNEQSIAILEPLLAVDPDTEYEFPELKARTSVRGALIAAYWGKKDYAKCAEQLEVMIPQLDPWPSSVAYSLLARCRRELGQAGTLSAGPMVVAKNRYVTGQVAQSNDRLLVSAAELAQRLALVAKPGSPGQLKLASDTHSLVLSAGSRQAVLDGKRVTLPVAPVTVKGKMLVPLRFVAEAFGHRVDWEPLPRIAWVR